MTFSIRWLSATVCAIAFAAPLACAEFAVSVRRAPYEAFVGQAEAINAVNLMIRMRYEPMRRFSPGDEVAALAEFNRLFPIAYPEVDVSRELSSLRRSHVFDFFNPNASTLGKTDVLRILSWGVRGPTATGQELFRVDGRGNCAGWTQQSLSRQAAPYVRRLSSAAIRLDLEDPVQFGRAIDGGMEFGDVVYLTFPRDFHVMTYAGTDAATGQRIVFTKNGAGFAPPLFMAYDDVFRFYDAAFGVQSIEVFRPLAPWR